MAVDGNRINGNHQLLNSSYLRGEDFGAMAKEPNKAAYIARDALEAAIALSERIDGIVKGIVGRGPPMPTACVTGDEVAGSDSPAILPALADLASRAASEIRDAHAALDRLDAAI